MVDCFHVNDDGCARLENRWDLIVSPSSGIRHPSSSTASSPWLAGSGTKSSPVNFNSELNTIRFEKKLFT